MTHPQEPSLTLDTALLILTTANAITAPFTLRGGRFMAGTVLITGGAGFIGSHLCDELLRQGYRVRALDSLLPQVHGPAAGRPSYLAAEVELIRGDVRDP